MSWVVLGASGFVGAAVTALLRERGVTVQTLPAPRLATGQDEASALAQCARTHPAASALAQQLVGAEVVVLAAGAATPDAPWAPGLVGANALLPGVVAVACAAAGVGRLVHLSSAAVQGRARRLDESTRTWPFSPYSRSKALGEQVLSALRQDGSTELVVLRATSVQGEGRGTTRALARLARSPVSSVAGAGTRPSPVSSVNGLAGFVHQVGAWPEALPPVVLQPWAGLTTAEVLRRAGGREPRHLPVLLCSTLVSAGYLGSRLLRGRADGPVRRLEAVWFGQEVDDRWARERGLRAGDGPLRPLTTGQASPAGEETSGVAAAGPVWWTVRQQQLSGERHVRAPREAAVELRDYLDLLRRRWVSASVVLLVVLASATTYALLATQQYTATTRLFFAVQGSGTVTDLAQGSTFAERQMTSYAQVASSPLVLGPVISQLGLQTTAGDLARQVTAVVPTDTVILEVSVTGVDPELATRIANAIGAGLAKAVGDISSDQADGSHAVQATVLAPAMVPTHPSSPNILRTLLLGIALGLVLGLGVALIRHLLDTKVRSEADLREITDSSVLGVIAFDDGVPQHPVILREDPRSAAAEAVRRLRTNLQFIGVAQQARSLVITSSVPGEGKSTTAINLAVALADAGARVLLVDADLRRPSIAEYLGLEGRVGLTTVLIGKASVEDVVQPWSDSSLDILPAGQIPPNPSELLGSSAMRALLDQLTATYDMVLIDSPPVLPVTDAAVLGRQVGGALLVAGMDVIHRPQLRETLDALDTAGCQVLGLVMNKIARREVGSYVYERGYYSSDSDAATEAPRKPSATGGTRPTARV